MLLSKRGKMVPVKYSVEFLKCATAFLKYSEKKWLINEIKTISTILCVTESGSVSGCQAFVSRLDFVKIFFQKTGVTHNVKWKNHRLTEIQGQFRHLKC